MSFVTGLLLIDAPASALNNLGNIPGSLTENTVAVKTIGTSGGAAYPYVSAQAFRYWLRESLQKNVPEWQSSPIERGDKIAYTHANPILYWDDDLLGYMRAQSERTNSVEETQSKKKDKGKSKTLTRVSPFRVSTLVSIAPTRIVNDFGVMARHEGNPVPHEHQFYRATLQGLFSLDLNAAGTFTYAERTGYLNLDKPRIELAQQKNLQHLPELKAYRLPLAERLQRVKALFSGLAHLSGGAKQTLHYTDVSPDVVFLAVTRGGNNLFGHIFGAQGERAVLNLPALEEALTVHQDDILSDVYVGWVQGFLDGERSRLLEALQTSPLLADWQNRLHLAHPRRAFEALSAALEQHPDWLA